MKTVLMVAEKPSLAKTIAEILSNHTSREVKLQGKSLHVWSGRFLGESVTFKMTSVFGHVYTTDFDQEFNKRIDPSLLFTGTIIRKDANPKLRVPQYLRGLAENEGKGLDYLVLWLDCDKEGENICFEVLDNVKRHLNDKRIKIIYNSFLGQKSSSTVNKNSKNVFRAKFSSLAPNEIKNAFENQLIDPNYLESRSVDARLELDLRIGCAFTRLQTMHLGRSLNQQEKIVVSFGPCQTPTLGFCVARDEFIKNFRSQCHWTLAAQVNPFAQTQQASAFKASASSTKPIRVRWQRGRMFDRSVVVAYLEFIRSSSTGNKALVKSINTNIRQLYPPQALNTVQLLRIASSAFGYSPFFTMELAEKLYTSGYISYPRTETTAYSPSFDFNSVIASANSNYTFVQSFQSNQNVPGFKNILERILRNIQQCGTPFLEPGRKGGGSGPGSGGKDVGDHPPITPTPQIFTGSSSGERHLSPEAKQLYDYVFTHFVATLMGNAKYLEHVTTFDFGGGELFTSEHKELMDPGYMEIMTWKLSDAGLSTSTSQQQTFREGQYYPITQLDIHEGKTKPPSLLTESELIKLMEEHGIGTDASIPVHIKKILDRNYVKIVNKPLGNNRVNVSAAKNPEDLFYDSGGDGEAPDDLGGTKKSTKTRYLMPTPLGAALVKSYEMIDLELVLPTMRAAMEKQLNLIASGQVDYDPMVLHALTIYQSKYAFFSRHVDVITRTFASLTGGQTPGAPATNYKITQKDNSSRGRGSYVHRSPSAGGQSFDGSRGGNYRGRGRGGSQGGPRGRRGGSSRGRRGGQGSSMHRRTPSIGEINVPYSPASQTNSPAYVNMDRLQRFL